MYSRLDHIHSGGLCIGREGDRERERESVESRGGEERKRGDRYMERLIQRKREREGERENKRDIKR